MVDALHEARRVLRARGTLVDARPDSRVLAKVEHDGVMVGMVRTQAAERRDDRAADRAVSRVKRERAFRSVRTGRFWHSIRFESLDALEDYLAEHLRFEHRARWTAAGRHVRRTWRDDEFAIVRAIRYEILERTR